MIGDLEQVAALLVTLESPEDNYPIINLEDAEISPFEVKLMAPMLADIPLAPSDMLNPVLDKLWSAGIPHIIIHVGEVQQPKDLISAIERAEDLGMITGIRGRATDLDDDSLLTNLATVGLDHLNFLFASSDPEVNDSLLGAGDYKRVLPFVAAIQENEIAPVAEVPLLSSNLDTIDETLSIIEIAGVRNLNFLAIAAPDEMAESKRSGAMPASSMLQLANLVEETANDSDVRFIWQPPLLRDPTQTINHQLRFGARCSSDLAIFVEPGGDVIPPRGPYHSAGNLLDEDWSDIWNDDAFIHFRKRIERPTQCDECPGLAICAADCPKNPKGWSQSPKVSKDE
jgi:radical SAM protein with 4Fe4S-binding SPASM domain